MSDDTTPATPDEALSAVVQRLRSELDGLRRAMRNRAVIEQAKGVLAARLSIGPEDAFDHLQELSQRTNTKLVEVAATLVGTTAPDPAAPPVAAIYTDEMRTDVTARRRRSTEPAPAGPTLNPRAPGPHRDALRAQHQLLAGRISSGVDSYDDLVAAIVESVTVWPQLSSVVLTLAEVDGALRLVASHGLAPEVRSQWSRIPPQVEIPLTAALASRRAVLLAEAEIDQRFPVVQEFTEHAQALACLPLLRGEQVLGVLGLSWSEPMRLTGLNRGYLLALAESCARALPAARDATPRDATAGGDGTTPRLLVEHQLEYGLLPLVLEQLYDPTMLLAPITEADLIIDFEFEYTNQAATRFAAGERLDLANSTLLEVFPEVGSRLLLGEYTKVLRSGEPHQLDDLHLAAEREGLTSSYTFAAHASRFADRVLVSWRPRTDADLLHGQLLEAERVARTGSFWWQLRSGDLRWSPQMYRLFDRAPRKGPLDLGELDDYVDPEDWLGVQNAFSRLLAGRRAEIEFRLTGRLAGRRLRLRAEPVLDAGGNPQVVTGTVRDVSEERAAEARLRRAEEALAAQRMRLESERHAAASLRDAVLPTTPELATAPGLTMQGLCRSAADPRHRGTAGQLSAPGADRDGPGGSARDPSAERVAGDWFDVVQVGGRGILVIGDVAGSGLAATTAATQLRSAVRAYAVHGLRPDELLTAVNRMLCELDPERMATLSIAEFTPQPRTLRWASAGQAPPVRYPPDGDGVVLDGETGVPIGVMPDAGYQLNERTMAHGERLLLYTDGLLARREPPQSDPLDVLLRVGNDIDLEDVTALVDRVTEKLGSEPYDDLCVVVATIL